MSSRRKRVTVVGASVVAPTKPTLTAPATNLFASLGAGVTVSATVTAGQVPDRIDFVLDPGASEIVIATDATSPYSQTWTPAESIGSHTLVARFVYGSGHVDSDPITLTIMAQAVIWLRADAGRTIATGVSNWADQSGNGNDVAQGSGTAQPAYEATGLGGQASILADGTNDFLASAAITLNQPTTVFCVAQAVTLEGNGSFFDGKTVNTMRFYDQGADQWAMFAGSTGPAKTTRDTNPHVFEAQYNGASSKLYVDGGTAHTGDPGAGNGGGLTLFVDGGQAAQYYNARIAEVIVFSSILAPAQRAAVTAYLGARYGITVT